LGRYTLSTREIALVSVFSAIWIGAEITLGPIIGRLQLGPFTMHGSVNRIVGWFLMLLLARLTGKFGRVSVMSLVASLGTRVTRLSAIEGFVVGAGYVLGGIVFDALYFAFVVPSGRLKSESLAKTRILAVSTLSGLSAILPYLLLKLSVLGVLGFLILSPQYFYSAVKGTVLSLVGIVAAMAVSNRCSLERFWTHPRELRK